MEHLKENSTNPYLDKETQNLVHDFLDRIEAGKQININKPNNQDLVFDCIFLLLRLGYDAQKLYQLANLSDGFLRSNFFQMGLREPPKPLVKVPNNPQLPNSKPSKIESFLKTVHSVKEQSQKSQSQSITVQSNTSPSRQSVPISKQTESEPPVLTVSTKEDWLTKSKVSLTDSDLDNKDVSVQEANTSPKPIQKETINNATITTKVSDIVNDSNATRRSSLTNTVKNLSSTTNVTKLVSLPAYNNKEEKFQKVIKDRLTKLSNINFLSKNSSSHIEETRQKLLDDVNKFMDYIESLRNKEKKNFNRIHSTNHEDTSKSKLNTSLEHNSPQQEVLISDSFVKMTKVCFHHNSLILLFKLYCNPLHYIY